MDSNTLGCGGNKGIIQFYGENDQYDFRQCCRIGESDLAGNNSLLDDFRQCRFQLTDQVRHIFLMYVSILLEILLTFY